MVLGKPLAFFQQHGIHNWLVTILHGADLLIIHRYLQAFVPHNTQTFHDYLLGECFSDYYITSIIHCTQVRPIDADPAF